MSSMATPGTSPAAPGATNAVVGDRYANLMSGTGPAAGAQERYQPPASDYRAGSTGYDPGNTGYHPATSPSAAGNTGYTPPDVYSPSGPASGAIGLPPRTQGEYRPGGTGNYVPPSGNALPPSSSGSGQADPRGAILGVTPASYQTTDSSAG